MDVYRKIWSDYYGCIPIDENNRTYEIHHKDGNNQNNDIMNLHCCSIQEHYDIHYIQEDHGACHAIALRMKLSPKEISQLSKLTKQKRIDKGLHNFLGNGSF